MQCKFLLCLYMHAFPTFFSFVCWETDKEITTFLDFVGSHKICSQKKIQQQEQQHKHNHNEVSKERQTKNMIFMSINVAVATIFWYKPSANRIFSRKHREYIEPKAKLSQKYFF